MNGTTTLAFVTGAFVIGTKWADGQGFDAKTAIGVGFYAIMLSLMDDVNHEIAMRVGALVLLVAVIGTPAGTDKKKALPGILPLLRGLGLAK